MGIKSAQAKSIRRKAALAALLVLIGYTSVFGLAAKFFWDDLYQKAAYKVAAVTAPWNYVTEEDYVNLYRLAVYEKQTEADQFADSFNLDKDAEDGYVPSDDYSMASSAAGADIYAQSDLQSSLQGYLPSNDASYEDIAFWNGNGLYAWRDLADYHAFVNAKPAALICCYLLGLLLLSLLAIPRLIKQIDLLASAISSLFADKRAPVDLPRSLSDAKAELIDIQNRELHNEQASIAAEQRKDELVAYLAHDIRTPLTSVIGYLDILQNSPDLPAGDRAKFARIAHEKALRLDVLMEEFFEITRYNLQSIPVEREQVDLELFCEQIAESLYPQAQAKSLSVRVNAPENVNAFIDPNKMARACGNILRNAIAYSNPGENVVFTARKLGSGIVIEIADRGKEISPEHLQSVFEKFFRTDAARNSNTGGAGLGLAIAKEIVEAHGGSIIATSAEGLTTFTVHIPQALQAAS